MIKRIIVTLAFTCACIHMQAQVNRVRNASFERYTSCPKGLDQVQLGQDWTTIDTTNFLIVGSDTMSAWTCAPEYINACAVGNFDVGVPGTASFYQYPRTGNGMMQMVMYTDTSYILSEKRNFLTGRLISNLVNGKNYCVTFYVTFNGTQQTKRWLYAVDHIGAYLDNGTVCKDTGMNYCGLPHPEYVPQVYTTTIITDTVNWIKVQGSFMADGTEKFITIGNFFNDADVNFIQFPVPISIAERKAVYLVDDVSVIESTEKADAGPDKGVAYGDSVHIGTNEEGMPCTWYVAGDTTPIGYSGGIWVKPTATTTYIVEMDLCGNVTRDSVRVVVWPTKEKTLTPKGEPIIWPNPVSNELHVSNATGSIFSVYDVIGGSARLTMTIKNGHEVINIGALQKGVYIVHIADPVTGYSTIKRIVKE